MLSNSNFFLYFNYDASPNTITSITIEINKKYDSLVLWGKAGHRQLLKTFWANQKLLLCFVSGLRRTGADSSSSPLWPALRRSCWALRWWGTPGTSRMSMRKGRWLKAVIVNNDDFYRLVLVVQSISALMGLLCTSWGRGTHTMGGGGEMQRQDNHHGHYWTQPRAGSSGNTRRRWRGKRTDGLLIWSSKPSSFKHGTCSDSGIKNAATRDNAGAV